MPTAQIQQDAALLHVRERGRVDQVAVLGPAVDVEADHVAAFKQGLQGSHGNGIAEREFLYAIVKKDLHAQRFGQDRKLHADLAVADDTEGLAPHLVGLGGGLEPMAFVQGAHLVRQVTQQQGDFRQGQFRDGAGIAEGRVEYAHAVAGAGRQVDLVRADAEGPYGAELRGVFEDFGGNVGLGADADDVDIRNTLCQFIRSGAVGQQVHFESGGLQLAARDRVDAFQQQGLFHYSNSLMNSMTASRLSALWDARDETSGRSTVSV